MPQIVWSADASGAIDYYNSQSYAYGGVKQGDIDGWKWTTVIHHDDLAATLAAWRASLESGNIYQIEHRLRKADSAYRWHLTRAVPVRDEQGRVVRWIGTGTDIDEQRLLGEERERLLTEVRHQSEELDVIFQAIPYLVSLHGKDGRWLKANPAVVNLFGIDPAMASRTEIAGRLRARFEDGAPLTDANMPSSRALKGEVVLGAEYVITDARGQDHLLKVNAIPLRKGGDVYGVVLAQTDITEQRRAERLLAESARFDQALNRINDLIHSTLDHDEIMGRVVAEAAAAFGCESTAIKLRQEDRWAIRYSYNYPVGDPIGTLYSDDEDRHTVLAVDSRKPVVIHDTAEDGRVNREHMMRLGIRSVLVVPLIMAELPYGALFFNYHSRATTFTEAQVDFAAKLAASLSLAIENARLYGEMEQWVIERTAELAEQSRRLDVFFRHSLSPLVFLDREFNFVRVNEAYARSCGREVDDFAGHNHFIDYPSEELKEKFVEVVETGKPYAVLARPFSFPDHPEWGVSYWDLFVNPIRDDRDHVDFLVFALNNVTDQTKAVNALRASEERYRSIFNNSMDGILLTSSDGLLLEANPAACRMLGREEQETGRIGQEELVVQDERFWSFIDERQRTGSARGEVTWVKSDGTLVPTDSTSVLFRDKDGNIRTSIMARDITERKIADRKIARLNRLYSVLSRVNEAIVRMHDTGDLYQQACSIPVELGLFKMAWVGLVDETTRKVRVAASAGDAGGYLENITILASDVPEGRGPTGQAITHDNVIVCDDIATDERMRPWRDKALAHGFRASAAFPLHAGGSCIGAITAYGERPQSFDEEEINLLYALADDISFAIDAIANMEQKRQAEEDLRKNAEEIQDLYNYAPCGYHSLDRDGVIIRINDTELGWLGRTREDVVGRRNMTDFFTPESRRRFAEHYRQFMEEGHVTGLEFDLVRQDGTIIPILLNASAVYDRNGAYVMSRSTAYDITERREAEQRTRVTNALLQLFATKYERREYLDAVCGLLHEWTGMSRVGIRILQEGKRIPIISSIGYSEEFLMQEGDLNLARDRCICSRIVMGTPEQSDLLGMTPAGSFATNDAGQFARDLTEEAKTCYRAVCMQVGFRSLAVIPLRYGEKPIGAIHLSDEKPGRFPAGKIEFIEQLAFIIAEAVHRFNVEEQQMRLASALEATADGVVITDPRRGIIEYVNSGFEEMTGYRKDEALGQTLHLLDSGKHDAAFYEQLRDTLRSDGVWRGRLVSKRKDGALYFEDCTFSPVKNSAGEIINYVSVKRDVTEKLRLESIAESVNTMNNIGYVFAGVRHEIGNPINSAKSILTVLLHKIQSLPPERVREYAARAVEEIGRVEHVLYSLKSFSLYESSALRPVDATVLMRELKGIIDIDLAKKGIALDVRIEPGTGFLKADPRALQQVLLNLVTNAVDALEERPEPRITIEVSHIRDRVILRVSDNGKGMTEKQYADLFKPFYTSKPQGTGLGLVIVKKMVTLMGGEIDVDSTAGKGTDVFISLEGEENASAQQEDAPGH